MDRNIARKFQNNTFGRGKTGWILLILMINILGIVQALTDCQIMNEWLPEMFDGTGSACCVQSGISCTGGSWGRINQM
jgi:hypothetical protein